MCFRWVDKHWWHWLHCWWWESSWKRAVECILSELVWRVGTFSLPLWPFSGVFSSFCLAYHPTFHKTIGCEMIVSVLIIMRFKQSFPRSFPSPNHPKSHPHIPQQATILLLTPNAFEDFVKFQSRLNSFVFVHHLLMRWLMYPSWLLGTVDMGAGEQYYPVLSVLFLWTFVKARMWLVFELWNWVEIENRKPVKKFELMIGLMSW